MGATLYGKRYREFGGKEQQPEPRVREFREFGTASLRGITVHAPFLALFLAITYSFSIISLKIRHYKPFILFQYEFY